MCDVQGCSLGVSVFVKVSGFFWRLNTSNLNCRHHHDAYVGHMGSQKGRSIWVAVPVCYYICAFLCIAC